MDLNSTPSGKRLHIGFFGKRNAGKSSVVNAITSQNISIVSEVLGTTTDPVKKAMELSSLGPVEIIDTPGIDDSGKLGEMRVSKTIQILNSVDVAILVVDANIGKDEYDLMLIDEFKKRELEYIIVYNKMDIAKNKENDDGIYVSAVNDENIYELKELIIKKAKKEVRDKKIVGDLIKPKDFVLLVTPIDESAPKGRLILPQQQTIRDILDSDAYAIVVKETGIKDALDTMKIKPSLVICDSQVFERTNREVPKDIRLTSFSILMARYKGNLESAIKSVSKLDEIRENDTILIAEGCTHHRQCNDIGTVKIPDMVKKYKGFNVNFEFVSGTDFPDDFSKYKMIIHCGGCMLNDKQMQYRYEQAKKSGIPITNYGMLIAYVNGIIKRSISFLM